ncbi:hypothetical protein SODALDRAFT_377965 [Sodiomyces alkalinus F11]|uniref:DJ-1/PfpI domain-containing protein n=1 Tax=Sodiomyces alkalinus (strain CBS 110278 / VKM F-3762 / F11) TaxID=1314773 RepID=A0A3N2Q008_SODAK|nr:hypothetical protein SODALDRAFT_377965 [Sodiomyces alkalinus F11]ROT40087.1 hypothetical protein SODALDRAFT_377965 [Sodiomyces alkalinus F11]
MPSEDLNYAHALEHHAEESGIGAWDSGGIGITEDRDAAGSTHQAYIPPEYSRSRERGTSIAHQPSPAIMLNKVVKVGVYIPAGCQLLDMACVDILHVMSHEYIQAIRSLVPQHMIDLAPNVKIFYITTRARMAEGSIPMTAELDARPTHATDHPDVAPGKLDIVVVPGPDPSTEFSDEMTGWLREQAANEGTDILSICTGILLCGAAGLLDGKKVCGPRGIQDDLKNKFPGAEFVGEKYRWYQDGRFWSAGGFTPAPSLFFLFLFLVPFVPLPLPLALLDSVSLQTSNGSGFRCGVTNGNDLIAAYARSGKHFAPALGDLACIMAEVGDRSQLYKKGQSVYILGMLWEVAEGLREKRRICHLRRN